MKTRDILIGDTAWFVAWRPDCDADDRESIVATKFQAVTLARRVLPQDVRGWVEYWPVQFRPYPTGSRWESIGETELITGTTP